MKFALLFMAEYDKMIAISSIGATLFFGGYREFNPLAVVFRPFRRSRIFRFWRPFKDSSHGHPEALHRMEEEFFGSIGVLRPERPAP